MNWTVFLGILAFPLAMLAISYPLVWAFEKLADRYGINGAITAVQVIGFIAFAALCGWMTA